MSLILKRADVIDAGTVDLTFAEHDGSEVTFRFTEEWAGSLSVLHGEAEFVRTYRRAPGPVFPMWPETLARQLLRAREEPLPTGGELARMDEEARRALEARWNASKARKPGDDG